MPQMVDEAGNIWEVDAQGNPVSFVGKQGAQQPQFAPQTFGTPRPEKPEKPQTIQRKDGSIVQVSNGQVVEIAGPTESADSSTLSTKLTAKERSDAISQYLAADRVLRQQGKVQGLFDESAGSTSGFTGLLDYFPTPKNDRLNTAGQRLRADMKKLQGFTGGEGNTLGEASLLYDPFLVSSRNLDQTAQDKIENMAEIAADARREAIMILGGVPDANGRVTPLSELNQQEATTQPQQRDQMSPAGNVPQGVDKSSVMLGEPEQPNNGGFAPYGAQYRTIDNPKLKGLNEALGKMVANGATRKQLTEYAASQGVILPANTKWGQETPAGRAWIKQNPGRTYPVNVDDMTVPMSSLDQLLNNAPQTRIGTALTTMGNAGGFGIPQMLAGSEGLDYLRSQNPASAFVGDVGGVIGGTALLGKAGSTIAGKVAPQLLGGGGKAAVGRQLATDATYGGIYGATTEGDPLTGAGTAAAGSLLGMGVGKGIQKGLQGVTDPAVQYLTQRGIPLTMGQTLGNRGTIGRTMNKLESLPVIGDMMGARRLDGMKAFEREALKDVVQPIGGNVTEGGTQGLIQAQDAVTQAYRDALSGVNVSPDAQFMTDAQAAMQAGAEVPKFGEDFTYAMNREVGPLFGQTGNLSGPELQSALQSISKIRSGFGKNEDAMSGYAADAAGQMDDALSGLVGRQAPDVMPAYNSAKGAFSRLAPFENARIGAINQEAISPAQLSRAVTGNTKNFGGRAAAARGDNLTDLMRYGQEVLPSTVPNSGSTDRMAGIVPLILPTALGGTAAYSGLQENPGTAGLLATLAAMSTKTGQKALQKGLTSRPSSVRKAGGLFGRRKAQQALSAAGAGTLLSFDGN